MKQVAVPGDGAPTPPAAGPSEEQRLAQRFDGKGCGGDDGRAAAASPEKATEALTERAAVVPTERAAGSVGWPGGPHGKGYGGKYGGKGCGNGGSRPLFDQLYRKFRAQDCDDEMATQIANDIIKLNLEKKGAFGWHS